MKGRLGLNWNLMCRIGFCLSLGDPTDINPEEYKADGSIEIERKILTGEEDQLYVALLIQR
ncbi:MAG TPA: DndE family protein, partial [Candidatus Babeliaceae bacterium]|nr:DndE family protein [Candidatus Babeliaceae bacterium]